MTQQKFQLYLVFVKELSPLTLNKANIKIQKVKRFIHDYERLRKLYRIDTFAGNRIHSCDSNPGFCLFVCLFVIVVSVFFLVKHVCGFNTPHICLFIFNKILTNDLDFFILAGFCFYLFKIILKQIKLDL